MSKKQENKKEKASTSQQDGRNDIFVDYEGISIQDRAYFILSVLNNPKMEHRGKLVLNFEIENNKVQSVKISVDGEDSLNLSKREIKNKASKYYHYVKQPKDFLESINASHLIPELLSDERQPKHHYSIHKNNSGKDIDSYAYSYDVHKSRVSKYPKLLEFGTVRRTGTWNIRELTFKRNFEDLGQKKTAFFKQFFSLLDIAYIVLIKENKELSEIEQSDLELVSNENELWNIKEQFKFWVNVDTDDTDDTTDFSCNKCDFTTKSEIGLKVHKTKMGH